MIESSGYTPDLPSLFTRAMELATSLLPFGTDSRLHWTGLAAFLLIGATVYIVNRKTLKDEGWRGFVDFMVPQDMYLSKSSLVDLKIYLGNKIFSPLISIITQGLRVTLISVTATATAQFVQPMSDGSLSVPMLVVVTLIAAIASDFATYWAHRAHHDSPLLWAFHKVHHSAEHMTPLTVYRKHPVYSLLSGMLKAVCTGPVVGVIFGLFGLFDVATILGINLVYIIFNIAGANLRHSHIWLDFGRHLDHIFISPAQHQIHHSLEPRHHDRNHGEVFALWDWMFGTLYVPEGREALTYGVADAYGNPEPQVHGSLKEAWLVPFQEFSARLKNTTETAPAASVGDKVPTA